MRAFLRKCTILCLVICVVSSCAPAYANDSAPEHVIIVIERSDYLSGSSRKNMYDEAIRVAESTLSQNGNLVSVIFTGWHELDNANSGGVFEQPISIGPTDNLDSAVRAIDNHRGRGDYQRLDLGLELARQRGADVEGYDTTVYVFSSGVSAAPLSDDGRNTPRTERDTGADSTVLQAAQGLSGFKVISIHYTPNGNGLHRRDAYSKDYVYVNGDMAETGRDIMKAIQNAGYFEEGLGAEWSLAHRTANQPTVIRTADMAIQPGIVNGLKELNLEVSLDFNWLQQPSNVYNHDLATTCMALDAGIYQGGGLAVEQLTALEFADCEELLVGRGVDTIHAVIGHQTINLDGNDYDLITIVLRGTYEWEWVSNMIIRMNPSGDYVSFAIPADSLSQEIKRYQARHNLNTANKDIYIITGHSRGGAVANLLAKEMQDAKYVSKEQVYAYAFATPNTTSSLFSPSRYDNIFNVVDGGDIVPILPPLWTKYGVTLGYDCELEDSIEHLVDLLGVSPALNDFANGNFWRHYPENYLARLYSGTPEATWRFIKWYYLSVECPTIVKIWENDKLVASIIGGEVFSDDPDIIATVDDDRKYFTLPANRVFDIEIIATDSGKMDYRIDLIGNGASEILAEESNIPLVKDDVFTTRLGDNASDFSLVKTIASDSGPTENEDWYIIAAGVGIGALALVVTMVIVARPRKGSRS